MSPRTPGSGLLPVPTSSGRRRKGDRAPLHVRVPKEHKQRYEDLADAAGLYVGDYIALVLARAHQLEEPDYIPRRDDELELPLGA